MSVHHHYNPDWLTDDALLASFVARQNEFTFLRDGLARAPLIGGVQHYLLVGVRGAGKTTLLKRLAVAIRRDDDLRDHLIALSFPEELYQVKNLADFWWAACDAMADALDALQRGAEADSLLDAVALARGADRDNPTSDAGLQMLQQICASLQLRPVLLVDNLDVVFERIDKNGRKLKDPHAPAYWALREALSTSTSPVVIGGSVKLTSIFTDYDKAFYDFFMPKRLGKLSLDEVREVIERLADAQGAPEVKQRLRIRPSRIETLFDLTGGNPRALGLIFELLRNGPNSRAVQDFERLMDLTTPYYKARIEDLSEQAQVIMHALAVRAFGAGDHLRFGHTAAEIGDHAGLPTSTVSTQLGILENEGLVEKSPDHGRTQYRIAEQLFRLWLQMRGTRRIRQNVIELTRFFEAMYDAEELHDKATEDCGANALSAAKFAIAVAGVRDTTPIQRMKLEDFATNRLQEYVSQNGGEIEDYLPVDTESVLAKQSASEYVKQGMLMFQKDDFVGAEAAFRQAIVLDPQCANAIRLVGDLEERSGNVVQARNLYKEAIMLYQTGQGGDGYANTLNSSGYLEFRLGNLEQARGLYNDAIALSEKEKNDEVHANSLVSLGDLDRWLGNFERARSLYDDAITLYEKVQNDVGRATALKSLGDIEIQLSNVKRARDFYGESVALHRKLNNDLGLANALRAQGDLEREMGNMGLALNLYEEAIMLYQKQQHDLGLANTLISLGDLDAHLDNVERARDRYQQAIALYQKQQANVARANGLRSLGDLESQLGNVERAHILYEEAASIYQKMVDLNPMDVTSWTNLAFILEALQWQERALETYQRAASLASSLHPFWKARQADLQARLYSIIARKVLDIGDQAALRDAMTCLIGSSVDIAAVLVSEHVVENFLAPALVDIGSAEMVFAEMRSVGYEKHARPLMLAFEMAMRDRGNMLTELEPELQAATKLMFRRLTAKPKADKQVRKRAAKVAKKG